MQLPGDCTHPCSPALLPAASQHSTRWSRTQASQLSQDHTAKHPAVPSHSLHSCPSSSVIPGALFFVCLFEIGNLQAFYYQKEQNGCSMGKRGGPSVPSRVVGKGDPRVSSRLESDRSTKVVTVQAILTCQTFTSSHTSRATWNWACMRLQGMQCRSALENLTRGPLRATHRQRQMSHLLVSGS